MMSTFFEAAFFEAALFEAAFFETAFPLPCVARGEGGRRPRGALFATHHGGLPLMLSSPLIRRCAPPSPRNAGRRNACLRPALAHSVRALIGARGSASQARLFVPALAHCARALIGARGSASQARLFAPAVRREGNTHRCCQSEVNRQVSGIQNGSNRVKHHTSCLGCRAGSARGSPRSEWRPGCNGPPGTACHQRQLSTIG